MAEHHYHDTYRETREKRSGGTIAFIVGGLVVAVGLILYWLFGGIDGTTATAPAGGADIEINATSDSAAGSSAAPDASAPAADTASTDNAASGAAADTSGGNAAATAGATAGN